jgi:hypothetical protein
VPGIFTGEFEAGDRQRRALKRRRHRALIVRTAVAAVEGFAVAKIGGAAARVSASGAVAVVTAPTLPWKIGGAGAIARTGGAKVVQAQTGAVTGGGVSIGGPGGTKRMVIDKTGGGRATGRTGGSKVVTTGVRFFPTFVSGSPTASVETTVVLHSGDAADDPCIWLHPTDPTLSTVIGTDKQAMSDGVGGLEVYDLSGARISRVDIGKSGVDSYQRHQRGGLADDSAVLRGRRDARARGVRVDRHRPFVRVRSVSRPAV